MHSYLIILKGSNLKKPSSYTQPNKFIGKASEYKDTLWAKVWKMGSLYITSSNCKHSSTHLIYLNSYACTTQTGQPGMWYEGHPHTSTPDTQNFSLRGHSCTVLLAPSSTLHHCEQSILCIEEHHHVSTAMRKQLHMGMLSTLTEIYTTRD